MSRFDKIPTKVLLIIVFILLSGIVFLLKAKNKPNTVEAGWWDTSWTYRQTIPITYSGAEYLTEYQVLVEIDTATLVSTNKLQSDCDDIRFTNSNNTLLPYSIVGASCNTSNTQIWVKTDSIPADNISIYFYYGNSNATSYQSEADTFSYSQEKVVGYVLNTYITTMDVISLGDSNSITHDGVTKNLNNFATDTFTSIADYGSVSAKKFFDMRNTTSSDIIVPVSWAGTEFIYSNRTSAYNFWITMVSPWGTASVDIYVNGSPCGTTRSVTNSGYQETACGTSINDVVRIISDIPILANRTASDGDDVHPMHPASLGPWYGFDSNTAYITSGPNGANYRWIDSGDVSETSSSLGANTFVSMATSGGSYYSGEVVRTRSTNYAIGTHTFGDADGGDATTYVLAKDFSTQFASPYSTDFVAIVSDQQTTCRTYNSSNTLYQTQTLESSNSLVYGLPDSSFGTGGTTTYLSGKWRVQCDDPVYVVSQYADDEQNMFSYPMMRQFTYPTPQVGSANPEQTDNTNYIGIGATNITPISSKVIAHWKFDEGYGTAANDTSTQNYTINFGSGNSAPTWTNNGKFGKALNFNGDNYSSATISNFLDQSAGSWTISAWVKRTGGFTSADLIIGKTGFHSGLGITTGGNQIRCSLINTSNTYYGPYTPAMNLNQWYHFVCQYNSSTEKITIYTNGKKTGEADFVGTIRDFSNTFYVGGNTLTGQSPPVVIDEVKLFKIPLTEDEVKQDYNSGSIAIMGQSDSTSNSASKEFCIPGDTSPCSPPIAQWTFDKRSTTTVFDISDNSNNGTLATGTSSPSFIPSKLGNALNFDGNDYVDVPHHSSIDFGAPGDTFTIEAWVKTTSSGTFLGKTRPSSNTHMPFYLSVSGSGFISFNRWHQTPDQSRGFTGSTTVNDNVWHHVVFVNESASLHKIYVDGVIDIGDTTTWTYDDSNTEVLNFGKYHNYTYGQSFYTGSLDNVSIYNYARTPAQIAWDYNRGAPIAHYKLDETTGATAHDTAGNQINGTLGSGDSAPTWTTSGKISGALSFDGDNDLITTNHHSSLDLSSQSVTLTAWIKPTSLTETKVVIGKRYGNEWDYCLEVTSDGKIRSDYYDSTNVRHRDATVTTNSYIQNDQWQMISIVLNKTDQKIYFYYNGSQVQAIDDTIDIANRSQALYIGFDPQALYSFHGLIDDVQIFNYPLTDDQIKTLYNSGAVSFN